MNLFDAYHERALKFRHWGEEMARADIEADYPMLRCLAHTAMNYGVLKNALRKERTEVLRQWLVGIDRFYGTQASLKQPNSELKPYQCGLRPYWLEESNVSTPRGIANSYRDWNDYLASKADHHYFNPDEVILNYGKVVADELGWETLSTEEQFDDLSHAFHWSFKVEFGDWLLFPSVDIRTQLKEKRGEVHFCTVRSHFYPLRKDEASVQSQLKQVASNQRNLHFSPHDFMGLDWVGWNLASVTHADEVWESYLSLMRTFHQGFERNLQNLGIAD